MAFLIQYSRMKKSKYCCHPPFHPPNICRHFSKLLSPTLPKLMNWILLSPPSLSSDPDNPPKFGTCTSRHCKSEDSSVILVALPPKWLIGHLVSIKMFVASELTAHSRFRLETVRPVDFKDQKGRPVN